MNPLPQRVCLTQITAIPSSLNVLQKQPTYMRDRGFSVHAISSPARGPTVCGQFEGSARHEVAISRSITPLRDAVTVFQLWRELRRIRPAIVESHMSKAGLLGTIAAWLANVPVKNLREPWRRVCLMPWVEASASQAGGAINLPSCIASSLRQRVRAKPFGFIALLRCPAHSCAGEWKLRGGCGFPLQPRSRGQEYPQSHPERSWHSKGCPRGRVCGTLCEGEGPG